MKTDEVREVLDRFVNFLGEHWRVLAVGVAGVGALLMIGVAVMAYLSSQETAAQVQLIEALRVHGAEIDPLNASLDDNESPTFLNEEDRAAAARERFQLLIDERGSSAAADVARVYIAELHIAAGEIEEARSLWEDLLDRNSGNAIASGARLNLINLDRQDGRLEEIAESLEQELADGSEWLPQDLLLYELAVTLEELGRGEEAGANFQRLMDDHPGSPYVGEARQRLASLS
jgi:tetratricopeptide (TPR) repeat protein